MTNAATTTEDRALALLGQGIGPEMVASAVGVSVSRISQLLSLPEFAHQVAELRYKNLAKHNQRDTRYDEMEDKLLDKLDDLIPFMMQPALVLKAIATINAAKRRGASTPDSVINQQTTLQLVLPTLIMKQFIVNGNNQVVKAGDQDLVTVQSANMQKMLDARKVENVLPQLPAPESSATSGQTS